MALTAAEQAELAALSQDPEIQAIAAPIQQPQQTAPIPAGLTPEEAQELAALQNDPEIQAFTTAQPAQLEQPQQPQPRPVEAAVTGFGQAATLGFLPQIQAAVGQVLPDPSAGVDEELAAQGFTIEQDPETYTQARDAFIRRNQKLAEENLAASAAGQVGGAVASGIATGGLGIAAKGATLAQRAATAAKTGGLLGFLENPGDTEGEVNPLQIRGRLGNAATGAITGAVAQGALEGVGAVGKALKELPDTVKNFAELKAVKSSGAMLKDFRKLFDTGRANKAGRLLLDRNLVQAGDDVERIAKKVSILKNETGQQLGDIYSKVNDELLDRKIIDKMSRRQVARMQDSSLDMERVAEDLRRSIGKSLKGKAGMKAVLSRVDDELTTLASNGNNLNASEVHKLRQSFDDLINFDKVSRDTPLLQQQFIKIRTDLNKRIQKRLDFFDDVFGSQKAKELRKLNSEFSTLAEIDKVAADRIARENANQAFGLSEKIAGGASLAAGTAVGGLPGGIVLAGVGAFGAKALRKYGTAATASMGNKLAKTLANNPSRLGEQGLKLIEAARLSPQQYMVTLQELLIDPEFKESVNKANSDRRRGLK